MPGSVPFLPRIQGDFLLKIKRTRQERERLIQSRREECNVAMKVASLISTVARALTMRRRENLFRQIKLASSKSTEPHRLVTNHCRYRGRGVRMPHQDCSSYLLLRVFHVTRKKGRYNLKRYLRERKLAEQN